MGILAALFIGWYFFERRASIWLEKVKGLLEEMDKHQHEGRLRWASDTGHPIALLLTEVTYQLVHDLPRVDEDLPVPWEQSVTAHAEAAQREVRRFFGRMEDGQIEICQAAAATLTQSYRLLERLQTTLQTGPDWIRQDVDVVQGLESALTIAESFSPSLLTVGRVDPMSRRVGILPGGFDTIEGNAWSVTLSLYLEKLLKLAKALDEQARREGFDWPGGDDSGASH